MIGKLTGIIDEAGEDFAVIDVGGVGYVVHCSARVLSNLPVAGQRTTLYVETQMREDSIKLFGFTSSEEREWFRLLQTVQGVGAKVALSLLSSQTTHELGKAIAFGDKAQIGRAQGVGHAMLRADPRSALCLWPVRPAKRCRRLSISAIRRRRRRPLWRPSSRARARRCRCRS
jgi:Holliday junction DNA helicase RuvA subunit